MAPTSDEAAPPRPIRNDYQDEEDDDDDDRHDSAESRPLVADNSTRQQTSNDSALTRAWNTTVATVQVYHQEIAKRFNQSRSGAKAKGKQRNVNTAAAATAPRPQVNGLSSQGHSFKSQAKAVLANPVVRAVLYTLLGIIVLLLLLIGIESAHLFTSTLSTPSQAAQDRILDEALVLVGPDSVRLLNISDDGIQVRVDGRLGLDPDRALDIWLGQRSQSSWWKSKDRDLVEWALGKVGGIKVEVGQVVIAEPDWTLAIPSQPLDLIPPQDDDKHKRSSLSSPSSELSSSSASLPRDLLTFNLEPLYVPFPGLLKGKSDSKGSLTDDPILGANGTRRAHLTLRPLNLTLLFKPVTPAPYLLDLGQRAIKAGNATLDIKVASLSVKGITKKEMAGGRPAKGWNVPGLINIGQNDLVNRVWQKIPKMKKDNSTDELLNLTRYDFFEIGGDDKAEEKDGMTTLIAKALGIRAFAEAKNPLGELLKGSVKYSLPFGIFLPVGDAGGNSSSALKHNDGQATPEPEKVLLAAVASQPFELDGQDKIKLIVEGRVVPPPKAPLPNISSTSVTPQGRQGQVALTAPSYSTMESPQEAALGNFLSRFLRGDANTVYVRGGSPFEKGSPELDPSIPGSGSSDLPSWLASSLSALDLPISFPGSQVTDLIKNVTIADLQIKPHPWSNEKLLFSGTILGVLGLPGELEGVDVDIKYLWPDILVYDGKPPGLKHSPGDGDDGGLPDDGGDDDDDDDDDDDPTALPSKVKRADDDEEAPPLPSPLPKNAFGRVRPHTWANATTTRSPENPKVKILRSQLVDVPFTVLPGRGALFRSFTWKLLTKSGGVEAGIEGSSRVRIWNNGLGDLEIKALPVVGSFVVGGGGDKQ